MKRVFLCAILCLGSQAAFALGLPEGAQRTAEQSIQAGRYALPVAVFDGAQTPTRDVDGAIRKQAFVVRRPGISTLQIAAPIRAEMAELGYEQVLDCLADQCGGFDFRFGTEVLPAPDMFVNLRDFLFMSFLKGSVAAPEAAISVLISVTEEVSYIQVIEVQPSGQFVAAPNAVTVAPTPAPPRASDGTAAPEDLLTRGSFVLEGVDFASGATTLGAQDITSVTRLAAFLSDNPSLRIGLVGHTDSVGGLDGNIRISKARAEAVRQRLIDAHGVAAERLEAIGAGYLAPVAANLTPEGRAANRRVEAILLSTE